MNEQMGLLDVCNANRVELRDYCDEEIGSTSKCRGELMR